MFPFFRVAICAAMNVWCIAHGTQLQAQDGTCDATLRSSGRQGVEQRAMHLVGGAGAPGLLDEAWESQAAALLRIEDKEKTGYIGRLTGRETRALVEVRQLYYAQQALGPPIDDSDLLRFLRARSFDPAKAARLLEESCSWWEKTRPDLIRPQEFKDLCEQVRPRPVALPTGSSRGTSDRAPPQSAARPQGEGFAHGRDRLGRPAVWFIFANHDPKRLAHTWRFALCLLEDAFGRLAEGREGAAVCFDLSGLAPRNVDVRFAIQVRTRWDAGVAGEGDER